MANWAMEVRQVGLQQVRIIAMFYSTRTEMNFIIQSALNLGFTPLAVFLKLEGLDAGAKTT